LRRLLSVLLSLLQFWITLQVASTFVKALAYLLFKAGASEAWRWYTLHPVIRGLLVGLFAGLIPMQAVLGVFWRSSPFGGSFLQNLDLDKSRRWLWLIFTPAFLIVLVHWWTQQSYASTVFGGNSARSMSNLLSYLVLTTDCGHVSDWSSNIEFECFERPVLYWLLTTSIGFSFAPMILRFGRTLFASEYPQNVAGQLEDGDESTIEVKTDLQ
jgi:hypothetical protein